MAIEAGLPEQRLRDIVRELATRPGHEKVRALVYELLVHGLRAPSEGLLFELTVPEVRGRADAILGWTILEFKRDLRVEANDAEEELLRYLGDRERHTGKRFVGIATDGTEFRAYALRGGRLQQVARFVPSNERPRDLLAWLDATVQLSPKLPPDPDRIRLELGRDSAAYEVARSDLADFWAEVGGRSSVMLKRQLWAQVLRIVYGSSVDEDDLFFQHTYLTVVAKTMATYALGVEPPEPAELLAGKPFHDSGIGGAVESDFFDWVLEASGGPDLVRRIVKQVARFELQDAQHDVLKGLYESLIDPGQRHDLGEYYTPDWLASMVCERAVDDPLNQRVVDPACGSGTFLFHAIRHLLAAADASGASSREALSRCVEKVIGVDIHPVAVLIARVTYLLALGLHLRDPERAAFSVPVYLGDSLQWNTEQMMDAQAVRIDVPDGPTLYFPAEVAQTPGMLDAVLEMMLHLSEDGAPAEALRVWLKRKSVGNEADRDRLLRTYEDLRDLRQAGRNHIWGYVARNLSRPMWLSLESQRADVVVGNPPWLSFRHMGPDMQTRFRQECRERNLWAGGGVATTQDLSGYFFVRCAELYLKPVGTIAFVMPQASLSRRQFEGFRRGVFEKVAVDFGETWALDGVQPLFPVPSCVIFANPSKGTGRPLSGPVKAFVGQLPRRDATLDEAQAVLQVSEAPTPGVLAGPASPYHGAFRQGATLVPRMLCIVRRVETGALGGNPTAPLVESRRTRQEKPPWRELPSLRRPVEKGFVRPVYLGESIAPFRILEPVLGVVPWDSEAGHLLDADAARGEGYRHLHAWMRAAEELWGTHSQSGTTFLEQLDYFGKLTVQMPPAPVRVLYSRSGTLPAAAVLKDRGAIADFTLYWVSCDEAEGRYLEGILCSETARAGIQHLQSRGQWGARDFAKVMLELPIPKFDPSDALHAQLAATALRAEGVAAGVVLPARVHFVRARQLIRQALQADGVSGVIDELVAELLMRAGQRI
ncbi:MAG: N-6 DNA methylase [Actinomycetota bacterium]